MDLNYQTGFGNEFATEAEPGALPVGCNNPQKAPLGLYAEQLSGSAFTDLDNNQRSWLYRILPSVKQDTFKKIANPLWQTAPLANNDITPNPMRWDPIEFEAEKNFLDSIKTYCVNGSSDSQVGCGIHLYAANKNMDQTAFYNSDGDLLFVPESGSLEITTEFGKLNVAPKEIAVVQRGIKFKVDLPDGKARGYLCEIYGNHLKLPYRGPIGANGLANARDFLTPTATYEKQQCNYKLMTKYQGHFFSADLDHTPFDVVAWHGNYAPYKYDLTRFNTMNSVSFDHPDPSIFTVLTSPGPRPGVANMDFVIFPERWVVAENTFRPPYYHRNIMSEFMGIIEGVYDAKPAGGGFVPGGASLHNCMSGHGPDAQAFTSASQETLKPVKYENTLAFMFESNLVFHPTELAIKTQQPDYADCWQSLKPSFK